MNGRRRDRGGYTPVPDSAPRAGAWLQLKRDGRTYWRLDLRERVAIEDGARP